MAALLAAYTALRKFCHLPIVRRLIVAYWPVFRGLIVRAIKVLDAWVARLNQLDQPSGR